jgi:hypothetical protein
MKILTKIIVIGEVEFAMARVMNVATLSADFFHLFHHELRHVLLYSLD